MWRGCVAASSIALIAQGLRYKGSDSPVLSTSDSEMGANLRRRLLKTSAAFTDTLLGLIQALNAHPDQVRLQR